MSSKPSPLLPGDLAELAVDGSETLRTKLHACAAYATQLGFQFGGEEGMRELLSNFAAGEAFLLPPSLAASRPAFSRA